MQNTPQKTELWIITAKSESSDHYGPMVFGHNPTDEDKDLFAEETGEERRYLFFEINKVDVIH